jgi:signal peptidase I
VTGSSLARVPFELPGEEDVDDGRSLAAASLRAIRDWVVVLVVALLVAFGIRTFVLQQFYVNGPSMETTLFQPNRVLVNKLSYRFGEISRGDVVVFDRVTSNGRDVQHDDMIKRVIGLPGESVSIRACVVYVDGKSLDEPYLLEHDPQQTDLVARCRQPEMAPVVVPDGQVFVLGDNRSESLDSRVFGPVDRKSIVGRAVVVIWPISRWRWL